jgi:sporulation protein YlmC with PRC-barrel domain
MKRMMSLLAVGSLICLPGIPRALADNTDLPSKYRKASDVLGEKVVSDAGENLGKIEEIVLDAKSGRIAYAVLSFGGFLGIGDKLFAIPWQALREDPVKEVRVLPVDKEKLKNAPGFSKDNWPDMAEPRFRDEIYRFYNIPLASGAEGWGVEARSFEAGPIENLKRESTELPLKLRKGTRISYQIDCPDSARATDPRRPETVPAERTEGRAPAVAGSTNTLLRLEVTELSGGEATVLATCSGKESKSCTIRVSENGTVQSDTASTESKGDAQKDAHFRFLVAHIFGQGLHGKKLEPGREYAMPGSLHALGHTEESTAPAAGRPTGAEESHAMRFEGVTEKQGTELAVFSLPGTSSAIRPTAGASKEEGVSGATAESVAGTRRPIETAGVMGRAAYRLDDGCLQKFLFQGTSVVRLNTSSEASPGN